jgi:hypothetical protein
MSLPLPDAFDYRGRSYFLQGCHGTALPGWQDFGLPKYPGWNAYRQTYGLWDERLVVQQIALNVPKDEVPPLIDGVTPRAEEKWGGRTWMYDLCRTTRFEGWLLIGDLSLRGDRLASMPVPWVGNGGVHFELGFVDGAVLEETDLTADVTRLFSTEVRMKRGRVKAPELVALLDRLEERYRIRPF